MLKNARGFYLHHHELYPLLGLRAYDHLPAEGFGPRRITYNGTEAVFICDPVSGNGRRSPHRIKVRCVYCTHFVPFGRYGQHQPSCKRKWIAAQGEE